MQYVSFVERVRIFPNEIPQIFSNRRNKDYILNHSILSHDLEDFTICLAFVMINLQNQLNQVTI